MAIAHGTPFSGFDTVLSRFRYQVELSGVLNGENRAFLAPEKFKPDTIEVYHNGRKLSRVGTLTQREYITSESGGLGTGFDTITFNTFIPNQHSVLRASYIAV